MHVPMFPRKSETYIIAALLLIVLLIFLLSAPIIGHSQIQHRGGPPHRGHISHGHKNKVCPTNAEIAKIDTALQAWRYNHKNKYSAMASALSVQYPRSHALVLAAFRENKSIDRKVHLLYKARQAAARCQK